MSHSANDKIALFQQEVMAKATAERDAILRETEESKRQELDREQSRQLEEIYRIIQEQINEINMAASRELAAESKQLRAQLCRQRELYVAALLARARTELLAFTRTPAYRQYLLETAARLAKEYPAQEGRQLELREEDLPLADELREVCGWSALLCETPILIGGLRLVDCARGLSVDCTLDSALERQRSWFYEHSQLKFE